jgi:hypothetical protein
MILITLSLKCDGCPLVFGEVSEHERLASRNDIELVRKAARLAGWRRTRPGQDTVAVDLCPVCVEGVERFGRPVRQRKGVEA